MDLHSDSPYWLMKNGMSRVYPSVQANKKTEVAILGAGITGAIMGYYLHKAGFRVMLIDKRYAIISEPAASGNYWHQDALIWETADPYLYLRTTKDNRIIIGGKDDDFSDPSKRAAVQKEKSKVLLDAFRKLLPSVPFKTDFTWSGAFSTSKDGLPYIGSVPERKNTFFALGFGGNGIVFGVVAAQIITDMLKNKKNTDAEIFRFNR